MKNKLTILIFIVTLLCTFYSFADDSTPEFSIGKNQGIPEIVAGEVNQFSIRFTNDSRASIERLEIVPTISKLEDYPFVIDKVSTVLVKHGIDSKESFNMNFTFDVKKTAAAGKYPLELQLNYKTWDGITGSQTETIYLNIVNSNSLPDVVFDTVTVEGSTLVIGNEQNVTLSLKNPSNVDIKNVILEFANLSSDVIQIAGQKDIAEISTIEAKTKQDIKFKMIAGASAKGPYQEVTAKISFKDEYDKAYEIEKLIRIPVESGTNYDANLSLANLSLPSSAITAGEDFSVSFNLKNNDDKELQNVSIKLISDSGIYTKSAQTIHTKSLPANGDLLVQFLMDSKVDTEAITHSVKVLINYEIAGTEKEYFEYINIPISKSGNNLSPKLILSDYKINETQIFAGESFPVDFVFENTNKVKDVYNVKISINSAENIFTPVDSSNVLYFDKIGANQNINKTLTLKSDYNAKPQNHILDVKMEYEDSEGKQYSTSDTISVPVWQKLIPRLSKIDFPEYTQVDSPISLSFDIYNIGKAEIHNIFVEVTGEDIIDNEGETYLGNLSEGSDTYYDGLIQFTSEGQKNGSILIKYQDDAGNEFTHTKEFTINVEAMVPYEDEFGMEGEFNPYEANQSSKNSLWIKFGAGIVVLFLIIFGILKYRKIKKNRKQVEQYDPLG